MIIGNIYFKKFIFIVDDNTYEKDNKFVMEYCSDERIYRTTYQLV